jgi:cytochrome c biogenesis protein
VTTVRRDQPASELSPREFARWVWRQLTSMRTALVLLLLLALVAIPGSVLPQTSVDARAVEAYRLDHPGLAPWLERLGLFHTYTSVWFSAVYLLLMTSLIGCIIPRALAYAKAFRARPPKTPANLDRLPGHVRFETDVAPSVAVERARAALRRARTDVLERSDVAGDVTELSAESGHLREVGNLIFHVAVVGVLVGVAIGALFGYRGSVIVAEGDDFSNVLTQYDDFASGALFKADALPPFAFHLAAVDARFQMTGPQRGAPRYFGAGGTWSAGTSGRDTKVFRIRVNHPLEIGRTSVFLIGQGYAPVVKVTDAQGHVVFEDAVPFLPSDGSYTSSGVVKVPDAQPRGLGFQGFFLPTAISAGKGEAPVSIFPAAANPYLGLFVFRGDLGLDDGKPQSVFSLDKSGMKQLTNPDGTPFRVGLTLGQVADLPGGGSIEFVRLAQYARLQISSSPFSALPLGAVILGVLGLVTSLVVRPRRTWVRARRTGSGSDSRTVVEVGALDRVRTGGMADHIETVRAAIEGNAEEKV